MKTKFLELKNISKSFGKVSALKRINFYIKGEPEIVGLIGDNGAGKSTLIKIISGIHAPDCGEIYINGKRIRIKNWSVVKSRASGVETVYQDRALAMQQTIARNIFMGRELTSIFGFVKSKLQFSEADRLMRMIGFTSKVFASDSAVLNLSGGERQGVAIARAFYFKANLMILDEPTTALSLTEAQKIFTFIRQAKKGGTSCIFITHNIYHAYDVSDRCVVLDRGKIIMETDREHNTVEQLIKDMQKIAQSNGKVKEDINNGRF